MKKSSSPSLAKRDFVKLACVTAALLGVCAVFFVTPALSTPTLLSVIIVMLLSPLVAWGERLGYSRTVSILALFLICGAAATTLIVWATQSVTAEWDSFRESAPEYFEITTERLRSFENEWKQKFAFLENVSPTQYITQSGEQTGQWFIKNGPTIVGDLLTWLLIIPILSFVMLKDGRSIQKKFFELVPNRFFESTFIISSQILGGLSDYIRAKLVEAFLVGGMTTVGLVIIDAPYAIVLGVIAGVTNILPYVGPIIGAIPGILIVALDPSFSDLLVPVVLVYLVANAIDMILIFPIIVASLVNLHPLILIAVVIVGQQYYGLVGMLISIPIATALKVVVQEIYSVVYEPIRNHPS